MKKLLGIVVLCLLWCNVSVAEIEKLPEGTTVNSLLKDLYKNHSGKVSDKWTIYLNEYENKLCQYQNFQ